MAVTSINLNRFEGLTRQFLMGDIPQFRLYNTDRSVVTMDTSRPNTLNANSSFTIPATRYSVAYDVNRLPTESTLFDRGYYLHMEGNRTNGLFRNGISFHQRAVGQAENFSRPLNTSMNQTSSGSGSFAPQFSNTVPAEPPASPVKYNDQLSRYPISDYHFDTLRNGPDFFIGRTSPIGFKVLTDGLGNITGIETATTKFTNAFNAGGVNNGLLPNRADITRAFGPVASTTDSVNPAPIKPNPFLQNPIQERTPVLNPIANTLRANPIAIPANNPFNDLNLNPVTQRLAQLLPPNEGLVVSGTLAEVDTRQVKQIATAQANFNLQLNPTTLTHIRDLQKTLLNAGAVYSPAQQAAQLTGTIPMVASLPAPIKSGNETSNLMNLAQELHIRFSADLVDKKGTNSYMPFMANNSHQQAPAQGGPSGGQQQSAGQFTGQFSGNQSGYSSQQNSQQQQQSQQPYKPLRLIA